MLRRNNIQYVKKVYLPKHLSKHIEQVHKNKNCGLLNNFYEGVNYFTGAFKPYLLDI